ncbi:MAG TPA: ParB/RepB/Spo0J family partition protein [Steroidobacteraceae bacterium]
MAAKKTGLGRGLEALLGQAPARAPAASEELARIPLDLLQKGRYQPRIDMRPETLQELADSIKAQGVVQPIVVRPLEPAGPAGAQRYEIIAGERRWRAAQMAGLDRIPAVIRRVPDESAVAMSLIENIQRENLNPLEEARALEQLVGEFKMTHQAAAEAVGRSRVAVSNLLRLLELGDEVKELVEKRELEMGHARALLALQARKQQTEVARLVAKKGLSVRETEALVRRLTARSESTTGDGGRGVVDPNIRKLQDDLTDRLGAKVTLQHNARGSGKLIVSYHSLDELDGILERIR